MTALVFPTLRAQDAVFTLYGEYLLNRERPVWVGSLIHLLADLGLSPATVRVALSRMARQRWLVSERRGTRSWYGLTARGRSLLDAGRARVYDPPRNREWDGTWHLVSFSIPETQRRLRHKLRVRLLWLGCAPLNSGLWISPHDVRAPIAEVARSLRLSRHVEVFRATHLGFSDPVDLAAHSWDLAAIRAMYESFAVRWRDAGARSADLTPAECFRRRFLLVHEFRAFPLADPFLPRALLPADWPGDAVARLFESSRDTLSASAETYVTSVVEADAFATGSGAAMAAHAATP